MVTCSRVSGVLTSGHASRDRCGQSRSRRGCDGIRRSQQHPPEEM